MNPIIYLCCLPLLTYSAEPTYSHLSARIKIYVALQPTRFIHIQYRYWMSCALTARFHPYLSHSKRRYSSLWHFLFIWFLRWPTIWVVWCSTLSGLSSFHLNETRWSQVHNKDTPEGCQYDGIIQMINQIKMISKGLLIDPFTYNYYF